MLNQTSIRLACAASLALLAWNLSGCSCTSADCSDGLMVSGDLGQPVDERALLTIEVCRNDACSSGELDTGEPQPNVDFLSVALAGDANAVFELNRTSGLINWRLALRLEPGGEAGDFDDGDVVTVRVVNAMNSAVLLDVQRAVEFDELSPNGDFCGPTCDFASIDLAGG